MALTDKKVSELYSGRDVSSLNDRPNDDGLSGDDLKARFDQLNKEVIPKYNQLIDLLVALLEQGNETEGHTHTVDNLNDGVTNRLFTEVLKLKLDGIASGAEVNQNAFSSIKVGATTGNADSKTATFEIVAGLNIVASIDPLTNKVTLNATGDIATEAVQSLIDDIGNYFTSLNVNGALQEIGSMLLPSATKTTPHDDDTMLIVDSQASNTFKNLSWNNIKATLKSYFDTLYNNYVHPANHLPSIITQDLNNRFVTDAEKSTWNGKLGVVNHDTTLNGDGTVASPLSAVSDATKAPIANPTFTGTQTLPNIVTNGIKFPATQVPSTDVNTLDDYEEGSYTPVVSSQDSGTITAYTINTATYIKIGKLISLSIRLTITNKGTGTGNLYVSLPFNSTAGGSGSGRISNTGASLSVGVGVSAFYALKYDGTNGIDNYEYNFSVIYTQA